MRTVDQGDGTILVSHGGVTHRQVFFQIQKHAPFDGTKQQGRHNIEWQEWGERQGQLDRP